MTPTLGEDLRHCVRRPAAAALILQICARRALCCHASPGVQNGGYLRQLEDRQRWAASVSSRSGEEMSSGLP
jgi:hypothetical protein